VIYSKSRLATTNLRLTELPDSWTGAGRHGLVVQPAVAGRSWKLATQGRFVIVPPVFN
jgi:hypothetical protein